MPRRGLEPLRISPPDPKSGASANFATLACETSTKKSAGTKFFVATARQIAAPGMQLEWVLKIAVRRQAQLHLQQEPARQEI